MRFYGTYCSTVLRHVWHMTHWYNAMCDNIMSSWVIATANIIMSQFGHPALTWLMLSEIQPMRNQFWNHVTKCQPIKCQSFSSVKHDLHTRIDKSNNLAVTSAQTMINIVIRLRLDAWFESFWLSLSVSLNVLR